VERPEELAAGGQFGLPPGLAECPRIVYQDPRVGLGLHLPDPLKTILHDCRRGQFAAADRCSGV
jgi:hypothetical protein